MPRNRMASCPHALPALDFGKCGPKGVTGSGLPKITPIVMAIKFAKTCENRKV